MSNIYTNVSAIVKAVCVALGAFFKKFRKKYCLSDKELISLCRSYLKESMPDKKQEILDSVSFRLDKGVNVNSMDGRGRTALMIASFGGNNSLPLVKLLLKRQPRFLSCFKGINTQDYCGNTALILASRRGSKKIVQELIDARANVTVKNNKGYTALMRAQKHGYTKTAKYLRDHGAQE